MRSVIDVAEGNCRLKTVPTVIKGNERSILILLSSQLILLRSQPFNQQIEFVEPMLRRFKLILVGIWPQPLTTSIVLVRICLSLVIQRLHAIILGLRLIQHGRSRDAITGGVLTSIQDKVVRGGARRHVDAVKIPVQFGIPLNAGLPFGLGEGIPPGRDLASVHVESALLTRPGEADA